MKYKKLKKAIKLAEKAGRKRADLAENVRQGMNDKFENLTYDQLKAISLIINC